MGTIIYLIRHSLVDYTEDPIKDKVIDLSPRGWEESVSIADNWSDNNIRCIYTSPLNRCIETLVPLALRLKIQYHVNDGLQELDYRGNAPAFHKNIKTDVGFHYEHGETLAQADERFQNTLLSICKKHNNETVVISSHGTVMSQFLIKYLKFNDEYFYEMTYPDVYKLLYSPDNNEFTMLDRIIHKDI